MMLFSSRMVSAIQVLSTCLEANYRGCQVIREFTEKNKDNISGVLKEEGEIKSVVTQADIDAQKEIINTLRNYWGADLNIVGEEDDDVSLEDVKATKNPSSEFLSSILKKGDDELKSYDEDIPLDEITVFVDPLDGTREFVEGRYENVGCLVGIARNSKAIGGVVGMPFVSSSEREKSTFHYSLLNDANDKPFVGTYPSSTSSSTKDEGSGNKKITVLTGDSKDPVLRNATRYTLQLAKELTSEVPDHVILGGTTSKLTAVSQKPNTISVLHFKTCLWDTCATEAVVSGMVNGKVTDLFGSPLQHSPDWEGGNKFGVISISGEPHMKELHAALTSQMRNDVESIKSVFSSYGVESDESQAIDIAKDLDGVPLTTKWLKESLPNAGVDLKSYSAPDSNAVRGLMSNGCRIVLNWDSISDLNAPSTAFYKRVDMSRSPDSLMKLKTKNFHKLMRDVKSYQVETAFLTSKACQLLREEASLKVNQVYNSDLRPNSSEEPKKQIQSKYAMLLEDFSEEDGWKQEWLISEDSAYKSLEAFAKLHAYFWEGSQFWTKDDGAPGKKLEYDIWSNGSYMQPSLQSWKQCNAVNQGWTNRLPNFEADLKDIPELQGVDLSKIGERLERISRIVGKKAHPFFDPKDLPTEDAEDGGSSLYQKELRCYRTFTHGDPKQANIFFNSKGEVGLIDFQWCGFGLAATDIAHHICASIEASALSYDGSAEKKLLDHYYDNLSENLIKFGVASSTEELEKKFSREKLQEQYEIAFLDVCRMVTAYAWKRWQPEDNPGNIKSLNRNSYNKSLPNVLWLIVRCASLLDKWEQKLLEEEI